ncbi:NUDIX domain-containing protein [Salinibacillus kushneri]|uniref:NUDIX domain-containing protein n=1 Tax=Salinibacillus kushneri TaxID=237682 RepID=A0A1I0F0K9_9BACI|nr:NUDIX hydrolase [Salinibacillus kushneri]SET51501.1 NUDIX domain-containing protein [Salinibacillus kushneri]
MKRWKTLDSEYLYKTPFGNLRKDKCELSNGTVIDDYYVNEYSDWVNAIVLTKDKQIVLVEQYRHAGDDFFLEIPAGKIEENESFEEGILREVREETGFTSKTKPIKLGEFMVNPATQNNKVITYLIIEAFKEFEQDLDDTEDIKSNLFDFDEMGKLLRTNQIKTQLFTANAYFMAKDFLGERLLKNK